ncbi:cupin domain-containing protein [Microbacterium azadirachtae]|uniref:Cupin domain protein n=1 Tax=Microbacterium azadirachtae TaxID=582680 RepID=A0A0F0LHL9_9MICO|nr:cupin domain-containing protein [Microbacterium azadirachtae]KJL32164.1 Cupin domain protein [Microbacterium azadirachtae]
MSIEALRSPRSLPTDVFDWGTIKWHVTPSTVPDATSTLGEVVIYPGQGHATHVHESADEVLYVIEGEGIQTVGDDDGFPIAAGDAIWVPKNTQHSTFNVGWKPLRLIATYTPGGEEAALRGLPDFTELAPGTAPVWAQANNTH